MQADQRVPEPRTRRFIDALRRLEADGDPEPLVGLYTTTSRSGNVHAPEHFAGPDGARNFWQQYRATFGEVSSTFRTIIAEDGRAALEWTTEGTTPGGEPLRYDGVSVLEFDGDQIARFQAYFDPAELGRQIEQPRHAGLDGPGATDSRGERRP